jgi:hypothetical protein
MRFEAGWSLSDNRIGCPMRHLTSPKHICSRPYGRKRDELDNVTAKVFSPARTWYAPRKDFAVHVSLSSYSIVKQQAAE